LSKQGGELCKWLSLLAALCPEAVPLAARPPEALELDFSDTKADVSLV